MSSIGDENPVVSGPSKRRSLKELRKRRFSSARRIGSGIASSEPLTKWFLMLTPSSRSPSGRNIAR